MLRGAGLFKSSGKGSNTPGRHKFIDKYYEIAEKWVDNPPTADELNRASDWLEWYCESCACYKSAEMKDVAADVIEPFNPFSN